MTKLIAIHSLHLASAVKGEVDLIPAGQAFIAREEELYLADGTSGAARAATAEDKGIKVAARAGADSVVSTVDDINTLTKAQLIALAAAEEIAIDDKATNKVIVETILAGRKAKDEDAI